MLFDAAGRPMLLPALRPAVNPRVSAVAPGVNNPQAIIDNTGLDAVATLASYAVGAEANRLLVVFVNWNDGGSGFTVSSVVFNTSESLTRLPGASHAAFHSPVETGTDCWYLLNPTNTTADIVVTMSASLASIHVHAFYLDGAEQVAPVAVAAGEDLTSPHHVSPVTLANQSRVCYGGILRAVNADISTITPDLITETSEVQSSFAGVTSGMGHRVKGSSGAAPGGWTHDGTGGTSHAALGAVAVKPS